MPYVKSRQDLVKHYHDTRSMLEASCRSFDQGNRWEAVRIATAIYTLVHDGGANSRSVLTQLGLRGSLRLRSRVNITPGNGAFDTPLVVFAVDDDGKHQFAPVLLDGPPGAPDLQFQRWWDQIVLFDGMELQLSRRGLVFALRNQDGGGHVDPELTNAAYVRFSRVTATTPRIVWFGGDEFAFAGIAEASVRHIAWELLNALDGPIAIE